ncbi:MAG: hypothetical protein NZ942_00065 [Candidatus Aenigmarchaeota archaeon]|nr:hypothetical protein [Candidatus Aenigmarchaeota archaeon]
MKEKKAVLICFSVNSEKFKSYSERNKFFKKLYGWKQVIRKEIKIGKKEKAYVYERQGLLDEIPHLKVDQSSFIVPEEEFEKIVEFLKEWHDKVIWRTFKVLLDKEFEELIKEELHG